MGFVDRELERVSTKLQAGLLTADERGSCTRSSKRCCGPWSRTALRPPMT
jgi:hypothetical protein